MTSLIGFTRMAAGAPEATANPLSQCGESEARKEQATDQGAERSTHHRVGPVGGDVLDQAPDADGQAYQPAEAERDDPDEQLPVAAPAHPVTRHGAGIDTTGSIGGTCAR